MLETNKKNLIKDQVVKSLAWVAVLKYLGQVISWIITIVVIRILSPEDYGLIAMASVCLSFLTIVSELGFGAAIIQSKSNSENRLSYLFGFILVSHFVIGFVLFLGAELVANYFDENKLTPIIKIISLNFFFLAFYVIPQALLIRNMNFQKKSIIELIATVTSSLITLLLALKGFGVWSLVYSSIIFNAVNAIGCFMVYPKIYMPKFSINKIKDFISFGKDIIIMRIMFSIFSKADIFIAGKILGTKAIGYYSVAIELVSIPMDKFMPIINQVAFPAFSIVQTNKEDVKYYFLKTMRLSSAILFPIFWGFGIISFDIIQSIFGPKWNNIIGPLQMLCIIMPFRAIATLFAPMLNGIGNTKIPLFYTTLGCLIMPISFYFGCGYGLNGLAIAWVFGYIIVFLISSKLTITALKIKIGYLIKNVFYGMLASAIMVIFIFIVKKFSQKYFLSLLEIILTILFGAVIYIGILALINRNLIYESFDLLKVLKKK